LNEEQDTQYEFEATVICERYFNEDSSWGVYVIDVDKDKFNIPHLKEYKTFEDFDVQNNKQYQTILAGNTVQLFIGQKYKVTARLKLNAKYRSWQYEPISIISTKPKTQDEQQKFLESIVTKNQAKTLIENYPNIVDDIINGTDNVDISKLHGIGEPTYVRIKNKILDNFVISDILVLLQPLGITFNMIKKLIAEEPNPTLLKEKLIDNPYIMTKIKGFGFKTVDGLALKLNPKIRVSSKRTYAFINYYLKEIGDDIGHTWVYQDNLESAVRDNINECIDIYHDIIKKEKESNIVLYFENNKVGLKKYHDIEVNIFGILIALDKSTSHFDVNIDKGIKEAEHEQGFEFTQEQHDKIYNAVKDNVSLISGKAGVGKSSIARALLKIYQGYRIGACALSAKAAQRITEATGFSASTIHRMLGFQGSEGFIYNHSNPLPYDVIFLDEASMVNAPIFYALLSAIKEGCKLIICGDDKQLPPIGYGNIFSDLISKENIFNVNQLKHVHRQAEK